MAWHALTHLVLAILKSEEPHKRLGIRMTPTRNTLAALGWAATSVALTRYALAHRNLPSHRAAA